MPPPTIKVDLVDLAGTPGTEFTASVEDSTAVISGIAKWDGTEPITRENLEPHHYAERFPTFWNGIPRHSITAKAMYNGDVYIWCKYKDRDLDVPASRSSKRKPVRFEILQGSEQVTVFNKEDSTTTLLEDPGSRIDAGGPKRAPRGRTVPAALITIKWNDDKPQISKRNHAPPGIQTGLNLRNTLNSNDVSFYGMDPFPPGSLKYIGPEVQRQDGRWYWKHVAVARVYYATINSNDTESIRHWDESYIKQNPTTNQMTPAFRDIYPRKMWW